MSLALESEKLLREIRDLRDRRRQQLDHDLAEIDQDYELHVGQLHAARRTGWVLACLWTAILLALAVTVISQ